MLHFHSACYALLLWCTASKKQRMVSGSTPGVMPVGHKECGQLVSAEADGFTNKYTDHVPDSRCALRTCQTLALP